MFTTCSVVRKRTPCAVEHTFNRDIMQLVDPHLVVILIMQFDFVDYQQIKSTDRTDQKQSFLSNQQLMTSVLRPKLYVQKYTEGHLIFTSTISYNSNFHTGFVFGDLKN